MLLIRVKYPPRMRVHTSNTILLQHDHQTSEKTYRFTVTTFNKKISNKQKINRIEVFELCYEKTVFCICENKGADQLCWT